MYRYKGKSKDYMEHVKHCLQVYIYKENQYDYMLHEDLITCTLCHNFAHYKIQVLLIIFTWYM